MYVELRKKKKQSLCYIPEPNILEQLQDFLNLGPFVW